MIIDAHTHLPTSSKQQCEEGYKKLEKQMDQAGIDYAIAISMFGENYNPKIDSENLIETCQKHPRIFPVATFDNDYPEESVKTLTELLGEDAVVGVKFFPGYQHFYPTSDQIKPVLNLAEHKGIPVIFHTGATAKDKKTRLKFCSDPYSLDEIAYAHPDLKIVAAHFNSPNFIQMAQVLENCPNMYADLSALFLGAPDYSENAYIPTLIRTLYDGISYLDDTSRLMFASDHPFCSIKDHLSFIKKIFREEFGLEDIPMILSDNAKKCFNLKLEKNDNSTD